MMILFFRGARRESYAWNNFSKVGTREFLYCAIERPTDRPWVLVFSFRQFGSVDLFVSQTVEKFDVDEKYYTKLFIDYF